MTPGNLLYEVAAITSEWEAEGREEVCHFLPFQWHV